jgi:hypothetical protein
MALVLWYGRAQSMVARVGSQHVCCSGILTTSRIHPLMIIAFYASSTYNSDRPICTLLSLLLNSKTQKISEPGSRVPQTVTEFQQRRFCSFSLQFSVIWGESGLLINCPKGLALVKRVCKGSSTNFLNLAALYCTRDMSWVHLVPMKLDSTWVSTLVRVFQVRLVPLTPPMSFSNVFQTSIDNAASLFQVNPHGKALLHHSEPPLSSKYWQQLLGTLPDGMIRPSPCLIHSCRDCMKVSY